MRVPWRDRHGRFLWLKAAVLATTPIPGLLYAFWWIDGALGARPLTEAIHGTGLWAIRWLLITLALTPFARLVQFPRILTVRRIAGLTAMSYALAHLSLYIVSDNFNLLTVVSEIALRFYLTIGFVALLGLITLGVTSTDGAMKRMGRRWKQLHRLAYPIGALGLLHYYIQTKANVNEPVVVSGLFVWLMVWRVLPVRWRMSAPALFALVPVSGVLTAGLEFAWYGVATRIDPFRILDANWNPRFFPRPAHWVIAVTLAVAVAIVARRRTSRSAERARPVPVSPASG
jgi:methionine sulfoxide reductase heme-binding subunit